ncbi:MAG: cell division protein ZapC domain-containing protein [Psychromonas sp.]
MDFIPKSNWQWVFDKQKSLLTLQMGSAVIDLVFQPNKLVLPSHLPIPFTVSDVARYIELFEHQALKSYQPEMACKIILHILAIELFHKPILSKSWLFTDSQPHDRINLDLMSHVILTAKVKHESATYLVIEDEKEFVLCLLIDQIHQITARKSLPQFQIIKVMSDKLTVIKAVTAY